MCTKNLRVRNIYGKFQIKKCLQKILRVQKCRIVSSCKDVECLLYHMPLNSLLLLIIQIFSFTTIVCLFLNWPSGHDSSTKSRLKFRFCAIDSYVTRCDWLQMFFMTVHTQTDRRANRQTDWTTALCRNYLCFITFRWTDRQRR